MLPSKRECQGLELETVRPSEEIRPVFSRVHTEIIHRLESVQLHLNFDTSIELVPSPACHSLPLIHACPSTATNLFFISVLCDVENVTGMESYNRQACITIFTKQNVLKCILSACVNHSHS